MLSEPSPKGINTEYGDGIGSVQTILAMDLSYEESDANTPTNTRKRRYCPACSVVGRPTPLRLRQINDDEAIYLCNQEKCFFPLLENDLPSFVVHRSFKELVASYSRRKRRRLKSDAGPFTSPRYQSDQFSSPSRISSLKRRTTLPIETQKQTDHNDNIEETLHVSLENQSLRFGNKNHEKLEPILPPKMEGIVENVDNNSGDVKVSFTNLDISSTENPITTEISNNNVRPENATCTNPISPDANDIEIAMPSISKYQSPNQQKPQQKLSSDDSQADTANNTPCVDEKIIEKSCEVDLKTEAPVETITLDVETPEQSTPLITEIQHCVLPTIDTSTFLLQWPNKNNSCWLDVILMCLATSNNIRRALNQNLSDLKDKEGNIIHGLCQIFDHCHTKNKEEVDSYVHDTLCDSRKFILQLLNKRFEIKSGKPESALEMFPNILKLQPFVKSLFTLQLRWEFECEECEYKQTRRSEKELISFPSTTPQFHPLNAMFNRNCFKCSASDQTMTLVMEKVPPCLLIHFQCGLPHNNLKVLSFAIQGVLYTVSAVIQYIKKPFNHFVAWVRNAKTNKWACCDGLKSERCGWLKKSPKIPADQVHIVMWERQSGDFQPLTNDDAFGSSYESGLSDEDESFEDVVDLEAPPSNPDTASPPEEKEEESVSPGGINSTSTKSCSESIHVEEMNNVEITSNKKRDIAVDQSSATDCVSSRYFTRSKSANVSDGLKEKATKHENPVMRLPDKTTMVRKEHSSKTVESKLTNYRDIKSDSLCLLNGKDTVVEENVNEKVIACSPDQTTTVTGNSSETVETKSILSNDSMNRGDIEQDSMCSITSGQSTSMSVDHNEEVVLPSPSKTTEMVTEKASKSDDTKPTNRREIKSVSSQSAVDTTKKDGKVVKSSADKNTATISEPTEQNHQMVELNDQSLNAHKPTADKPKRKPDTIRRSLRSLIKESNKNERTQENLEITMDQKTVPGGHGISGEAPKNIRDSIEELYQEQDDSASAVEVAPGVSTFFERNLTVPSKRSAAVAKEHNFYRAASVSPNPTQALLKAHNIAIEELKISKNPVTHPKFIFDGMAITNPSTNNFSGRPLVFLQKPAATVPPPTPVNNIQAPSRFLSKTKPGDPEPSVMWNPMKTGMLFKTSLVSNDPLRMQFVNKTESQFTSYKPKRKFKLVGYKKASQNPEGNKQRPYKASSQLAGKENSVAKPFRPSTAVNPSDKNSVYSDDISTEIDRLSSYSDGSVTTGSDVSIKSDPALYKEYSSNNKQHYSTPFLTPNGSVSGSPRGIEKTFSSNTFSGQSIDDMVDNFDPILDDDTLFESVVSDDYFNSESSFLNSMDNDPLSFLGI